MKNIRFCLIYALLVFCFKENLVAQKDIIKRKVNPNAAATASAAAVAPRIDYAAFHDMTVAQYEAQFVKYSRSGYRLTSLDIYRLSGSLDNRYACVWVKDNNNVAWSSSSNLTSEQYQSYFNAQVKAGYRPTVISGVGGGTVGNNKTAPITLAAVFEKGDVPFEARHNIDVTEFDRMNKWAQENGYYPRWVSIYGGRDRLYAAVWEKSSIRWWGSSFSPIDSEINIPMTNTIGDLKLNFVTLAPFGTPYYAVYTANSNDIKVCNNLNSATYQQKFNSFTSMGYIPVVVHVASDSRLGSVSNANYMGIFRKY
jgi:hypothetical protein